MTFLQCRPRSSPDQGPDNWLVYANYLMLTTIWLLVCLRELVHFERCNVLQEIPSEQVVEDLVRASRIFVAIAANSLVGQDGQQLSIQQYRALALLASEGHQRPADLARSLGVTPSTTTALCDRLVEKGMISRGNGTDRRSISLVVSGRGHELLKRVAARRGDLLRDILLRLPLPTQIQLGEGLLAFIEVAGDVEINEWSIRGL